MMVATMNTLVADLWSVDAIVDFIVKRKRRSQTVLCSTWISFCNWKVFPCVYGAGATQAHSCCSLWNGRDLESPAGVSYQHHLAPPELITFVRICRSCSLCVCWLENPIASCFNQSARWCLSHGTPGGMELVVRLLRPSLKLCWKGCD